MADYMNMPMEQLASLAAAEAGNVGPVLSGAQLWGAVPQVLGQSRQSLGTAADRVGEAWQDPTYQAAFREPVGEGEQSIQRSEQIVSGAAPAQALQTLGGQIGSTSKNVAALNQQYQQLQQLLQQLMALIAASPFAAIILMPIIMQIKQKMEQLRMQAASQVTALGQTYGSAGQSVQAAAQGHRWAGPTAGGPPSPGSDSDALGASPALDSYAGQPSAVGVVPGNGGTAAPALGVDVQGGAGGADGSGGLGGPGEGQGLGSGVIPQAGETGLAGGVLTMPPASTIPPVATPQVTGPVTTGALPPVGPVNPLGLPAVATGGKGRGLGSRTPLLPPALGAANRKTGGAGIPRAAQIRDGITAASVGKAPTPPSPVRAGSALSTGTPSGPATPGAMTPMNPVLSNLESLIQRLKPGTAKPSFFQTESLGSRVPGVPASLRGRVRNDGNEFNALPVVSARIRRNRDQEGPQTVELLDEELWQTDQDTTRTPATT